MAKSKAEKQAAMKPAKNIIETDDLDALLDDVPVVALGPNGKPTNSPKEKKVKVPKDPAAPKAPRVLKGIRVTFQTQKGETVTGTGVLYYVTRMNGKLYYKEASQVTLLPDDWQEGDPIPGEEPISITEKSNDDDLLG